MSPERHQLVARWVTGASAPIPSQKFLCSFHVHLLCHTLLYWININYLLFYRFMAAWPMLYPFCTLLYKLSLAKGLSGQSFQGPSWKSRSYSLLISKEWFPLIHDFFSQHLQKHKPGMYSITSNSTISSSSIFSSASYSLFVALDFVFYFILFHY